MELKSFREFSEDDNITEAPIAMGGDWENHNFKGIPLIKKKGIEKHWVLMDNHITDNSGKVLLIYKSNTDDTYIAGVWGRLEGKEGFIEVIRGSLRQMNNISRKTHQPVFQMERIYMPPTHRFKGIGLNFYSYFIKKLGYTICSDSEQYDGARKIYASLADKFQIDIYDNYRDELITTNYKLEHGDDWWDYDESIYSCQGCTPSKETTMILVHIK